MEKRIDLKIFSSFFDQKLQFIYSQASIKSFQATGKAFSPQKKTSSTSKNVTYKLFPIFVGHFCHPGSGSRNHIESGSGSTTLKETFPRTALYQDEVKNTKGIRKVHLNKFRLTFLWTND
jgi:hypothetical protein